MKNSNYIRSMAVVLVILLPLCMQSQGLTVGRGASVVMNNEVKLVLHEASLINHGRFIAGRSTIFFTSDNTVENVFIGGNAPVSFYNLSINRPAGILQLENEFSITGVLAMQGGNIELNRHNIALGRTGIISGENIQSYITGKKGGTISAIAELRSPQAINPGNIGVALTSAVDHGTTLITRGHVQQTNAYGTQGIYRYYDIKPAFNANANIKLRFYYLDAEMGDNNKSDLVVWSDAGNSWMAAGKDHIDVTGNSVDKNNVKALSRFTLGRSTTVNPFNKLAGAQKFMQVHPNPAQETFTAVISSARSAETFISLQDQRGHTLDKKKVSLREGLNTVKWNISKYAAGTYHLVFEDAGLGNVQIVKQ